MKNVITWKDADQNLCTLAALILDNAMKDIRGDAAHFRSHLTTDGETIPPGWVSDIIGRTIFSGQELRLKELPTLPELEAIEHSVTITPLCWWSYQNIIRQRLNLARIELRANRYGQERHLRSSKQKSRNPIKRLLTSKFGRESDRR